MGVVDLQAPGQRRRRTVELLVEPVAQAADRLGDQQCRGDGVGQWGDAQASVAHEKRRGQKTSGNAAPDAQAAQPHLRDEGQVPVPAEVGRGRGQNVVDAGSDDAGRDSHDGDV